MLLRATADEAPAVHVPVGGANAPAFSSPVKLIVGTAELDCGTFSVRVPTGTWADEDGAASYSVPGPIVAFKGADGIWRGHGYLETYPRLLSFEGTVKDNTATLSYRFQDEASYDVTLTVEKGVLLMHERSKLGPRNVFVFDAGYGEEGGWRADAGLAVSADGKGHASLYLPCHYDKPEVTIQPAQLVDDTLEADERSKLPIGVAVLRGDRVSRDVAGFWCRAVEDWQGADSMGIQLWQRRQRPGDPGSRHFIAPETKSDGTPNPHTAPMIGTSLYEGHVTVELSLGIGERKLGFVAYRLPDDKNELPNTFKQSVRDHR